MASYHYVSASLPFLLGPTMKPPLTSIDLMEICTRLLLPKDHQEIQAIRLNPENSSREGLTASFHKWEASLRNDLVRLRVVAYGRSHDTFEREEELVAGTASVAAEAMGQENPLAMECYLDRLRWNKLDELVVGHFFDMEFLRAYRLKLLLLERHALFNEEEGFAVYQNISNRLMEVSED